MIARRLIAVALALLPIEASAQPRRMGVWDLGHSRIAGETQAIVAGASASSSIDILVTVAVDGRVIDARVDDNFDKLDPTPAIVLAKAMRFAPLQFDGRPIEAVGRVQVSYVAPIVPPDPRIAFPQGAVEDAEISLQRGACLGSCPDYRVTLRGDGSVRFSTRATDTADEASAVRRA